SCQRDHAHTSADGRKLGARVVRGLRIAAPARAFLSSSVPSRGLSWWHMAKMMRDKRTPVLLALILSMALVAMDTTIVATAVPQVVADLGGFTQIGWVFSVYLLAQTVTIPIYGKLADLYGRKPILVFGVSVFLLGSLLSALAWNMVALIVFRAIQGFGAGSIGATVNTVAGDIYSVEE